MISKVAHILHTRETHVANEAVLTGTLATRKERHSCQHYAPTLMMILKGLAQF